MPKPSRVREPVQVYLDPDEKQLLEELARMSGQSQAEVLRRGIRRLAADRSDADRPGSSLVHLLGVLGEDADLPADLAARHDDYLYGDEPRGG